MGDKKTILYKIISSKNVKNNISIGFTCPECGDIYAIGNYFLKSTDGNILIKKKLAICIYCQTEMLPDPLLFQNFEEIYSFAEKCERGHQDIIELDGWIQAVEIDSVLYANRLQNSGFYCRA